MSDLVVYKLVTVGEYEELRRMGEFRGSPADIKAGFIHMSSRTQLAVTVEKHFRDRADIVVAAIDLGKLGNVVRWEPSRNGELFPHLYGALPINAVMAVAVLERLPDGSVRLPV
ncbi:MAG: DUF952 domain-containing protein [Acetobacteraceae bacterium]|nr:DUF952 domain-containing protein [Acetobacteraceae bacterium]